MRTARKPILVAAEFDAELFVVDPEVPIRAARHCIWHYRLHFLRNHADIGLFASDVAEAIVAEAVIEMTEQDDIVFQLEVGATATTASTTASAAAAESASATTAEAATTTEAAASRAGKASPAARRCSSGRAAR